jgi:hypothetical protein
MRPKHVALIAAAALTTGWLLASIVSPPVAELQVLPLQVEGSGPSASENTATTYTEQLRLKLRSAPQPPTPRRNPFAFQSHQSQASVARRTPLPLATASIEPIESPQAPTVSGPSLRLSGIGSTNSSAGRVWSAVISDGRTVHIVGVGESLAGYSVVAITEDSVTMADASGMQWTLRLQ